MTSLPGLPGRLVAFAVTALLACSAGTAILPPSAASAAPRKASLADLDGDGLTNTFELTRSHTNPLKADTDGDGVPDWREDPDHDRLDNLWEQRLGLNPLQRDSDHDRITDDQEDYDGDGLSNIFEIKGKVSDPRTADSNGDGVPDGAEDPDGDGLSNLGEQRFGTNPLKADTDGDGIPDGAEDANHNGISNAAEQDAHAVPANLTPTLAAAVKDVPQTYHDGCHIPDASHTYKHCTYGTKNAPVRIALFGDSHAADWFPALQVAAADEGWRLDNYTRSGCPWADVKTWNGRQGRIDVDCANFRRQALASMAASPPTIVIVTSLDGYPLFDENNHRIPDADYESTWDAGMASTLGGLPAGTIPVVLEDTPIPNSIDVPACLKAHPAAQVKCERSPSRWIDQPHADAEQATALANGALFANLNEQVCPYDPCAVVVGNTLVYRDSLHLTATFARSLAPTMETLLDGILPP